MNPLRFLPLLLLPLAAEPTIAIVCTLGKKGGTQIHLHLAFDLPSTGEDALVTQFTGSLMTARAQFFQSKLYSSTMCRA
jgi:hypothetical protein